MRKNQTKQTNEYRQKKVPFYVLDFSGYCLHSYMKISVDASFGLLQVFIFNSGALTELNPLFNPWG